MTGRLARECCIVLAAEPREEWVQVTFFKLQFNGLFTIRVHTIEEPEFGISRRGTGGLNQTFLTNVSCGRAGAGNSHMKVAGIVAVSLNRGYNLQILVSRRF